MTEPKGRGFQPSVAALVVFFVIAGGIYLTGILAVALLRHVLLPIFALLMGFWCARAVYRGLRH